MAGSVRGDRALVRSGSPPPADHRPVGSAVYRTPGLYGAFALCMAQPLPALNSPSQRQWRPLHLGGFRRASLCCFLSHVSCRPPVGLGGSLPLYARRRQKMLSHTQTSVVDCPTCGRPIEISDHQLWQAMCCSHCGGDFVSYRRPNGTLGAARVRGLPPGPFLFSGAASWLPFLSASGAASRGECCASPLPEHSSRAVPPRPWPDCRVRRCPSDRIR